jgi:transketolase
MRNAFRDALSEFAQDPAFVFLTGDLGYNALESLRDAMGARFINAGVAEQNMVSVAAGLARSGLRPWAYSIAPFIYARPYEQIRNDICLHDLPVVLVGNGGGYGYGAQGGTHHALEDYGALCCLRGMRCFVPVFDQDLRPVTQLLRRAAHPSYLRLGVSEAPAGAVPPEYSAWRHLLTGRKATVLAVGPLAGGIWAAAKDLPDVRRPSVWALAEMPVSQIPCGFIDDMKRTEHLVVVEEHVAAGGGGQQLVHRLVQDGFCPPRFTHRCAQGYVTDRYGPQQFFRRESGIDPASVVSSVAGD